MIEWTTRDVFYRRLQALTPHGLHLRTFVQATCDEDPQLRISREAEPYEMSGVGEFDSWTGFVGDIPFHFYSGHYRTFTGAFSTDYGVELEVPYARDGDRVFVEVVEALGLPQWKRPWLPSLPVAAGFSVVRETSTVYTSASRDDAEAIATMVTTISGEAHHVAPAAPLDEPAWIVAGVTVGRFVSAIEVARDEAAARRMAASRGTTDVRRVCTKPRSA